jgi:hypothetical protein
VIILIRFTYSSSASSFTGPAISCKKLRDAVAYPTLRNLSNALNYGAEAGCTLCSIDRLLTCLSAADRQYVIVGGIGLGANLVKEGCRVTPNRP